MIKILIAEDHALVREGLRNILEKEPTFEVIGEATTGLEASEMTERLDPNVLLLDLTLPRLHGLDVLTRVKNCKRTKVIVVSMHGDAPSVLEALRLGACGYVLKESPASELVSGIKAVHDGGNHLSASLRQMVRSAAVGRHSSKEDQKRSLTRRERMVLQKVGDGLSSEEIGRRLGICAATVGKHRMNIGQKIGAKSQADMIRYAMQQSGAER